jgi:hypothetical protein
MKSFTGSPRPVHKPGVIRAAKAFTLNVSGEHTVRTAPSRSYGWSSRRSAACSCLEVTTMRETFDVIMAMCATDQAGYSAAIAELKAEGTFAAYVDHVRNVLATEEARAAKREKRPPYPPRRHSSISALCSGQIKGRLAEIEATQSAAP